MDPFQSGYAPAQVRRIHRPLRHRVMYPSGGTGYAQTAAFTAVLVSWFLYAMTARRRSVTDRGAHVGAVVPSPRRDKVIPATGRGWPGGGERATDRAGEQHEGVVASAIR